MEISTSRPQMQTMVLERLAARPGAFPHELATQEPILCGYAVRRALLDLVRSGIATREVGTQNRRGHYIYRLAQDTFDAIARRR